jgi:hypothetical protein
MIDSGRLTQVIHGLRLILRLEPGGLSFFEKTYPGFVRSFYPALVLAPLQILESVLGYPFYKIGVGMTSYFVIEALFYVLSCALFPFVMLYITALLGRSDRYFDYIVPYNWLMAIPGLAITLLHILAMAKVVSGEAFAFWWLIILGIATTYSAFLARVALKVPAITALGIVVLDIILLLGMSAVSQSMERPQDISPAQEEQVTPPGGSMSGRE